MMVPKTMLAAIALAAVVQAQSLSVVQRMYWFISCKHEISDVCDI